MLRGHAAGHGRGEAGLDHNQAIRVVSVPALNSERVGSKRGKLKGASHVTSGLVLGKGVVGVDTQTLQEETVHLVTVFSRL